MFGKAKKGRGEMFQSDIEFLDLHEVKNGAQFQLIWISHSSLVPISFYNSLAISHLENEIVLLGGLPTSFKDNSGFQSCYKVVLPPSNNQTSPNYFIIERLRLQNSSQF